MRRCVAWQAGVMAGVLIGMAGWAHAASAATVTALNTPTVAVAPLPATPAAPTAPAAPQWQDPQSISQAAEQFLRTQTDGLPGKVTFTLASPVRQMPACTALEPFLPPGARLWGMTTVGVRCVGARPWTIYLQARISVTATYFVVAHQVNAGETVSQADLVSREGDLTSLPRNVVTDPSQAVGAVATNQLTPGLPLRQDMLRSAIAVTQGQTVRVIAKGAGFEVSTEGQALARAGLGDTVQVRTRSGQVVSGTVHAGHDNGAVEVDIAL